MRCAATTGSAPDARAVDTLTAAELAAALDEPEVALLAEGLRALGFERIVDALAEGGSSAPADTNWRVRDIMN
jgi:hypothetical protein